MAAVVIFASTHGACGPGGSDGDTTWSSPDGVTCEIDTDCPADRDCVCDDVNDEGCCSPPHYFDKICAKRCQNDDDCSGSEYSLCSWGHCIAGEHCHDYSGDCEFFGTCVGTSGAAGSAGAAGTGGMSGATAGSGGETTGGAGGMTGSGGGGTGAGGGA